MQEIKNDASPTRRAGGAGDPKKGGRLLRERAAVRFQFIAAEQAHYSLGVLCRGLRVTRSGFHAWRRRPQNVSLPARRNVRDTSGINGGVLCR
jgi:hypothetical protein